MSYVDRRGRQTCAQGGGLGRRRDDRAVGGEVTPPVATTPLLPSVLDAVAGTGIPVIAAGGFFDGRGLPRRCATAPGATGTRFLLTRIPPCPTVALPAGRLGRHRGHHPRRRMCRTVPRTGAGRELESGA